MAEPSPPPHSIDEMIVLVRGQKVMIDDDLARLYGVETKNLNKAVRRNSDRFPDDFMFQLTPEETDSLRFQFGTSNLRSQNGISKRGGRRYLPYAFTEQGVAMLSSVRDSDGTLVLILGPLEGGSALTVKEAAALKRPCLVIDFDHHLYDIPDMALEFIAAHRIAVLNVAGPQESSRPGIYDRAYHVLRRIFEGDDGSQMLILKEPPRGGSDSAVA